MDSILIGTVQNYDEHFTIGRTKVMSINLYCRRSNKPAVVMVGGKNRPLNFTQIIQNLKKEGAEISITGTTFFLDGEVITRAEIIIDQRTTTLIYPAPDLTQAVKAAETTIHPQDQKKA
jgi:hypothetical protein